MKHDEYSKQMTKNVFSFVLLICNFSLLISAQETTTSSRVDNLTVLRNDANPKVLHFRTSEKDARKLSWEEWYGRYSGVMWIVGKALSDEVVGNNEQVLRYFNKLKLVHPDQMVFLHFNENARDSIFETEPFFAGHWIYYTGATVLNDLQPDTGICEIQVTDPDLFRTSMGRFKNKNEDIGICELDAAGKPNWHKSEQVKLLSGN